MGNCFLASPVLLLTFIVLIVESTLKARPGGATAHLRARQVPTAANRVHAVTECAVNVRASSDLRVLEATAVVVGGGASGLSAAAALTRRGIDVVVLEQDSMLGGTWARRYERLHLHTVRRFSGLAHFPIPGRYPRYLSRDDVVAYLEEYAAHFRLRVIKGVTVRRIRSQSGPRAQWTVETSDGTAWSGRIGVATGQYRQPIVPSWPGRECYAGRLVHSAAYVTAAPYAGQRVLVVGAGNSGAEIATDLADHGAAYVALSVRSALPIVTSRSVRDAGSTYEPVVERTPARHCRSTRMGNGEAGTGRSRRASKSPPLEP